MQQAVFCSDLYFLLPPEYPDFESFRAAADAAPKPFEVKALVLREDHRIPNHGVEKGVCMAPFFLTGYHDVPSLLRIRDAEDLYPAQVELLSQEEYNARLRRLVTDFCPGCTRYKPLTNRVQSLNGHFEEIALDGFCAYRVETRPSPRSLRHLLFTFGGFWKHFSYGADSAEAMGQRLKEMLYLNLAEPLLTEEDGEKHWSGRAKTVFDGQVASLVAAYVQEEIDPAYHIAARMDRPAGKGFEDSAGTEDFRKACKKYGLSLLTLRFAPQGEDRLRRSLAELTEHWYLFPLDGEAGCLRYYALDSAAVRKALHYRLPLLRTLGLSAQFSDQYGSKEYAFDETMHEV